MILAWAGGGSRYWKADVGVGVGERRCSAPKTYVLVIVLFVSCPVVVCSNRKRWYGLFLVYFLPLRKNPRVSAMRETRILFFCGRCCSLRFSLSWGGLLLALVEDLLACPLPLGTR